jgi:L-fucose mutarotase
MLKGINPIVSPDLVHALCAMGHGHTIAVVDANYPLDGGEAKVIRMDGVPATDILDAILSLMPVETGHKDAACRMVVDGDPKRTLPLLDEFEEVLRRNEPEALEILRITSGEFKFRAAAGSAVVMGGDCRVYGNFISKKGVVTG